jgi:hypothetical protein
MKVPNAIKKSEVIFNKLLDFIKDVFTVIYDALTKVPILNKGLIQLNKLFINKNYLYVVLGLSLLNIIIYAYTARFGALAVFFLVGIFMTNFSKNMAVVLTMTLLFSSVFLMGSKVHEGMTSGGAEEDKKEEEKEEKKEEQNEKKEEEKEIKKEEGASAKTGSEPVPNMDKTDKSSSLGSASVDDVLNPEAIKNLTKETMELMGEQKKLFASMNEMGPLLAQAQEMLAGFDMAELNKLASMSQPVVKEGLYEKKPSQPVKK